MKKRLLLISGLIAISFLISSCQKDEIQMNVTQEVEKFEGYIANYDKLAEENNHNKTFVETKASDDYIAIINEALDKKLIEVQKAKSSLKYTTSYWAGYLQAFYNDCHGSDQFVFYFDGEDGRSGTVLPEQQIASYASGDNVYLKFCVVNANYFHSVKDMTYGLLMLSPSPPLGVSYMRRHFDTEDGDPQSKIYINGIDRTGQAGYYGLYAPNSLDAYKNITLYFYVYLNDQSSTYTEPAPTFAYNYGVLGHNDNTFRIHIDDEDYHNANTLTFYKYNPANHLWDINTDYSYISDIGSFNSNTDLRFSVY